MVRLRRNRRCGLVGVAYRNAISIHADNFKLNRAAALAEWRQLLSA